jgi:lipopolysaccharide biosynthesis glycosyltransferase
MTDTEDIIQVVLAVYDPSGKYSRHAGVVMTSIFERTKSRARVTILHDITLTEDNRARFQRTADTWNQEVQFINVSEHILKMGSDKEIDNCAGGFSRGTLFRLLIPNVMDVSKVIYLDCDVVVNLDITELWVIDIDEFFLAATLDRHLISENRRLHGRVRAWAMRYDGQKYFNNGVLLMNLNRIRSKKPEFMEETKEFLRRYRFCSDFADQDFNNFFFRGEVRYIEERFDSFDRQNIANTISHLAGLYKPWTFPMALPADYLYWETFARSAWQDQLFDAMCEMFQNTEYIHSHSSWCYRRILKRWKADILTRSGLVKLIKDFLGCLGELCYRLQEKRLSRKRLK